MSTRDTHLRTLLAGCVVLQSLAPSVAPADPIFGRLGRLVHEATYHGVEPTTCEVGAIEELAENIDWLEHHIDKYGSVVAKQPDIWGEARLTKHRDEYERILFRELSEFEFKINAAIAQSDTAFFAQAIALSNAVSGSTPDLPDLPDLSSATKTTANATAIHGATSIGLEPTIHLDQLSRYVQHLHELRRINEGDDGADSPGYSLNLVRVPVSILPGKLTDKGFGAEVTVTATPVITDDLLPTTFRNLLINDLTDQLGLPLVRTSELGNEHLRTSVDVSDSAELLEEGFNAIYSASTESFESELSRVMDMSLKLEQARWILSKAIEQVAEDIAPPKQPDASEAEVPQIQSYPAAPSREYELRQKFIEGALKHSAQMRPNFEKATNGALAGHYGSFAEGVSQNIRTMSYLNDNVEDAEPVPAEQDASESMLIGGLLKQLLEAIEAKDASRATAIFVQLRDADPDLLMEIATKLQLGLINVRLEIASDSGIVPTGRARRAIHPTAPSQAGLIGIENFEVLADSFEPNYSGRLIRWSGGPCVDNDEKSECRIDLLDAQRWLQSEAAAAHEMLSIPEHLAVLHAFARPESGLADAIRANHLYRSDTRTIERTPSVVGYRKAFFSMLHTHAESNADARTLALSYDYADESLGLLKEHTLSAKARNSVEAIAWAYVVNSALLNARLNEDIRKLARAKQRPDLDIGRDLNFFLPDGVLRPDDSLAHLRAEFQEATTLFQRYVEVRWPIYCFALDPREQDQNVADASARRREMQFAMSLAFVTGQVGVNSLTQFARAQEKQIETISLNRTAAAFAHGSSTFGWRFTPRVQALEQPGTLGAFAQTLCGVHPDADINNRMIEPGMREAIALVVMPSFVPYVDFDVRTNWFKLSNPKNAAVTMKDTMRLSRAVTAMRNSKAHCSRCQHLYRDGELTRLYRRVDQLDAELPLQSARVQAPYENTLGGFEMFNTGVTDLAPELIGWYGAPGVVVGGDKYACGCTSPCTMGLPEELQIDADGKSRRIAPCEGEGTTLFLVGSNFSVHDTKTIAGGVCIPHVRLVSREIIQVTLPSCLQTVSLVENGRKRDYVAIYAATPYGVTNHLHIPVQPNAMGETIAAAIQTSVADTVNASLRNLRLAPCDLTITPLDADNGKVIVEAHCVANNTSELNLNVLAAPSLMYTVQNLDLRNGDIELWAAVKRGDTFVTPLQKFDDAPISPAGAAEGIVDSNTVADFMRVVTTPGLNGIVGKIPYASLADDGKDKLSLVFYARFCCPGGAIPVADAVEIEVRLACACCGVAAATPAPCGCGTAAPQGGSAGETATGESTPEAAPGVSAPAAGSETEVATPTGLTSSVAISNFLVPPPSEPAPAPPEPTCPCPPVVLAPVNVTIVQPPAHKFFHGPHTGEVHTHFRESWRNVQDAVGH